MVLHSLIILTSIFGRILMKRYKNLTSTTVLFIKTHWMIIATNMLYFKYLSNFYPDKKLVFYTTMHLDIAVKQRLSVLENRINILIIPIRFIEFVGICRIYIYQLPDKIYNKPFNALIYKKYNDHTSEEL